MNSVQHPQATRYALNLTLAASLLVLAQTALAADEINITPGQRQVTVNKPGIITLRFEVENRSGQTQQLEEQLTLPEGWELITNTAPFLLSNGARDVRLVHVTAPPGTAAGTYMIGYQVTASNNGGVTSSQTVAVQMEEQAGVNLTASAPPGSLLGGESFTVDFTLENTGNHRVTYQLSSNDEENYITSVEPRSVSIAAGESSNITVKGTIPRDITETTSYRINLEARGGGKLAQASTTIPLIARTSKGLGKYQKLPGKLTTRYTRQTRQNTDGSNTSSYQAQAEYYAHGAIDPEGKHNIEIRARNGKNSSDVTNSEQQSEYQFKYQNGVWEVSTGNQNFHASNLSGNSLSGVGVEATYTPRNKKQRKPLAVRAFSGRSCPGDTTHEKVSGATANYQWEHFDAGVSIIEHSKEATATTPASKETVKAVNGGWHNNNIRIHSEAAEDNDGHAWSIDASGQWKKISLSTSYLKADPTFDGSSTDALQSYSTARYQLDDQTSIEANTRHTRNNLRQDITQEVRDDREHQVRVSRRFGQDQQIEVSLGQRLRTEKDLRITPTTDRTISDTSLEYQQQFEKFFVRAKLARGSRKDRIKSSSRGTSGGLTISWKPTAKLSANASLAISNGLDSDGKNISVGANATYQLNKHTAFSGYWQRSKNTGDNTHADSFEAKLTHETKQLGTIGLGIRRTNNLASDGRTGRDNMFLAEYSVPLDMPIRRRRNIGSVDGKVHYAEDQRPASDIVVQMGGQYAVTDQNGTFHYPDVLAKDYTLNVDSTRSNSEGYMLTENGAEASVNVLAGQTSKPTFELHRASRVTGKIQTYAPNTQVAVLGTKETPSTLTPQKGLGMVLVELRPVGDVGKRIVYKRTTLYDGSFSFAGIPPGNWELVVVDSDKVPDNYRFEQTMFAVNLNQGGDQEILVRALPMIQNIKKTGPTGGFNVIG
jgi:hypothetical protein